MNNCNICGSKDVIGGDLRNIPNTDIFEIVCLSCLQPERLSPEGFQRTGAGQNIDPEYVRMVGGISSDLLGPSDSPTPTNK